MTYIQVTVLFYIFIYIYLLSCNHLAVWSIHTLYKCVFCKWYLCTLHSYTAISNTEILKHISLLHYRQITNINVNKNVTDNTGDRNVKNTKTVTLVYSIVKSDNNKTGLYWMHQPDDHKQINFALRLLCFCFCFWKDQDVLVLCNIAAISFIL